MNPKKDLLLRLKEEYDCMEKDVRNMTDAIAEEDNFKKAYDCVSAVLVHALNMEDLMMNYKRLKIKEEN